MFDFYQAILEATVAQARREGRYDDGITDVAGTSVTVSGEPEVTRPCQADNSSSGTALKSHVAPKYMGGAASPTASPKCPAPPSQSLANPRHVFSALRSKVATTSRPCYDQAASLTEDEKFREHACSALVELCCYRAQYEVLKGTYFHCLKTCPP